MYLVMDLGKMLYFFPSYTTPPTQHTHDQINHSAGRIRFPEDPKKKKHYKEEIKDKKKKWNNGRADASKKTHKKQSKLDYLKGLRRKRSNCSKWLGLGVLGGGCFRNGVSCWLEAGREPREPGQSRLGGGNENKAAAEPRAAAIR